MSMHAQARAVKAIFEGIEIRVAAMANTLHRPMSRFVWWALGLLGAMLLFVIIRH